VPSGVGMRNVENGLIDALTYDTWMTDIDICQPVSWFYQDAGGYKSANLLIDMLAGPFPLPMGGKMEGKDIGFIRSQV